MPTIEYEKKKISVDDEGYLENFEDWDETVACALALCCTAPPNAFFPNRRTGRWPRSAIPREWAASVDTPRTTEMPMR